MQFTFCFCFSVAYIKSPSLSHPTRSSAVAERARVTNNISGRSSYLRQSGSNAIRWVCQSSSLSFCAHHYCRSNQPISFKLDVMTETTNGKKWLTFRVLVVIRSRIPDHIFHYLTTAEFGDLLAVLIQQSPADFHNTRRNAWRRQGKIHIFEATPQTSGSESGLTGICIWIRNHYFLVGILALMAVCTAWAQSDLVCSTYPCSQGNV